MTRWDYTEHPSAEAMDFLAQQAIARANSELAAECERNLEARKTARLNGETYVAPHTRARKGQA